MSDSFRPHGLQHARLPCPSPALVISCLFVNSHSDGFEGRGFEYRGGCDFILRVMEPSNVVEVRGCRFLCSQEKISRVEFCEDDGDLSIDEI